MQTYRPVWNPGDPTPLCLCGCGQPVGIATQTQSRRGLQKGQPYNYKAGHHPNHNVRPAIVARMGQTLPKADFERAIRQIMARKGWTLADIRRMTGVNVNSLLHDRRRQTVGKQWAQRLLRQLAGGANVPTARELREVAAAKRRFAVFAAEDALRAQRVAEKRREDREELESLMRRNLIEMMSQAHHAMQEAEVDA